MPINKQTLYNIEDVLHLIEHVLGIDLPDALRFVKRVINAQHMLQSISRDHRTPCFDCKHVLPRLVEALENAIENN